MTRCSAIVAAYLAPPRRPPPVPKTASRGSSARAWLRVGRSAPQPAGAPWKNRPRYDGARRGAVLPQNVPGDITATAAVNCNLHPTDARCGGAQIAAGPLTVIPCQEGDCRLLPPAPPPPFPCSGSPCQNPNPSTFKNPQPAPPRPPIDWKHVRTCGAAYVGFAGAAITVPETFGGTLGLAFMGAAAIQQCADS